MFNKFSLGNLDNDKKEEKKQEASKKVTQIP